MIFFYYHNYFNLIRIIDNCVPIGQDIIKLFLKLGREFFPAMQRSTFAICLLLILQLTSCSSHRSIPEPVATPLAAPASHYRQHGDADSLRSVAADLKPGMQRDTIVHLLGPPAYSPTDSQDYYPTELRNENGHALVLVVNYHAEGTAAAGTVDWFFLDYIGE